MNADRTSQTTLIEQSSKRYKGAMLFGLAIAALGLFAGAMVPDWTTNGIIAIGAGLAMFVLAAIARWWHHA